MKPLWLALAAVGATAHGAGTVSCPDLAAAVEAVARPSEAQPKYASIGYCADSARIGIVFTQRTRAACRLARGGDRAAGECWASCE